jgi:hypothetical protein
MGRLMSEQDWAIAALDRASRNRRYRARLIDELVRYMRGDADWLTREKFDAIAACCREGLARPSGSVTEHFGLLEVGQQIESLEVRQ